MNFMVLSSIYYILLLYFEDENYSKHKAFLIYFIHSRLVDLESDYTWGETKPCREKQASEV